MTALKTVLIVDKTRQMLYANVLKTKPVMCLEHQSYLWYAAEKNCFHCKAGKHDINYNANEFKLVEI